LNINVADPEIWVF